MLLGTPEGMQGEEEVGVRIAGREGEREGVLVDTNSGGRCVEDGSLGAGGDVSIKVA